jgi:hypothetical protein
MLPRYRRDLKAQQFERAQIEDYLPEPDGYAAGTSSGLRIQGNTREEWIQSDNPLQF